MVKKYKQKQMNLDFWSIWWSICTRNIDACNSRIKKAYKEAQADPAFQQELDNYLKDYVGRSTL